MHEAPTSQPSDQASNTDRAHQRPQSRGAWSTLWHLHPTVRKREDLTVGERCADYMRKGMGSWAFVFGALAFLAGWIIINVIEKRRGLHAFDAYPFILLNLCLSCLAAMQGAILLIAAKREDQVSSDLAHHDYETNLEAERIVKAIHKLTIELHEHVVGSEAADTPST